MDASKPGASSALNGERVIARPQGVDPEVDESVGANPFGYRPALDGIRAVAVLLVIVHHVGVRGFALGGAIGVTVFFALSGFLITTLLTEERAATGRIAIRGFYRRRAVRLLPALIVFLVAMLTVRATSPGDALAALAYYANWVAAGGGDLTKLSHTWSLAVEEQFYMVWPVVFAVLGRRRRALLALALAGAAASMVVRLILWDPRAIRVYFGSDTRADALLLGCAAALLLGRFIVSERAVVLAAALLGALMLTNEGMLFRWGFGPAALASCVVVAGVAQRRVGTCGILESTALVHIGRLSYGLYLWHYPLARSLSSRVASAPLRLVVVLGLTYLLAATSARLVERPLQRFRTRRSARSAVVVHQAGEGPEASMLSAR
jgi:peptidoglycan/LPS O-acetylase OafA/YrhL